MNEFLENLVKTGGLKQEPPDANESAGLKLTFHCNSLILLMLFLVI
jgi:hypothetical protein